MRRYAPDHFLLAYINIDDPRQQPLSVRPPNWGRLINVHISCLLAKERKRERVVMEMGPPQAYRVRHEICILEDAIGDFLCLQILATLLSVCVCLNF